LGFVVIILLSLTSIVSKQNERIKTLVQANTLLEKRIRELEEPGGNATEVRGDTRSVTLARK
jgi:type II secretory pathway component PulJ